MTNSPKFGYHYYALLILTSLAVNFSVTTLSADNSKFLCVVGRYDSRTVKRCTVHYDDVQTGTSRACRQVLWRQVPQQGKMVKTYFTGHGWIDGIMVELWTCDIRVAGLTLDWGIDAYR